MIATLILLNRFAALRTLLCVSHYPSYVFTFSWVFRFPKICNLTITRPVWLLSTPEAEWIPTFAVNIRFSRIPVLYTVITTLVGTPTNILVIISVSLAIPFHVSLQIFILEVFQKYRMRYHDIAHVLRAFAVDTLEPVIHFLLQVALPILFAELMATNQAICAWLVSWGVELGVTNLAVTLVLGL